MASFAFTFGLPGLLWGLGLASAPIIIHLLNRRRHKVTDWAAMKWLLEAIKKRNRRIQMEQWLLLALRTLVILLVVLAMSKPTFETARAMFVADTPATHHILVFDNSMSMQYALANWNRWERAKGMAQAILDGAQTGDQASVIVMGVASTVLVGDPSPYLRDVMEEIDALRPEHGTARIESAVDQVAEILKISRATKRRVYLITDMQKSSWALEDQSRDPGELGRKLQSVSEQADFTILDVGGESPNHAVIGLEMVDPLAVLNRPVVLRATVGNYATAPAEDVPVELSVDGQIEAIQNVTIAPGEQKVVSFNVLFREPGDRVVTAKAGEDALRIDDQRSFIVKVRQSLSVLVIEGEPSGEPFQSESDYLKIALSPTLDASDASLIRPEIRLESDLLESDLDDWDIVILCNVGQLTTAERNRIAEYLRQGGGVIFFLGTQTNLAAYNEILFEDGKGPLPARLVDVMGEEIRGEKFFRFDPRGYVHPLVELFRDREDAGLLSTRVQRYVKAALPPGSSAQVPLAYNTDDPAIILAPYERGQVALVTTSASLDWTTWPISHSFVPIVQELARQMIVGRVRREPTLVGEPLVVPVPREVPDNGNVVLPPGEERVSAPARIEEVRGTRCAVFGDTGRAGIYELELAGSETSQPLAVTTWPRESDLLRLTADELKAMFPGWNFAITDRWEDAQAVASLGPSVPGELHRPLLYAALAILFIETWLARKFSHHA